MLHVERCRRNITYWAQQSLKRNIAQEGCDKVTTKGQDIEVTDM